MKKIAKTCLSLYQFNRISSEDRRLPSQPEDTKLKMNQTCTSPTQVRSHLIHCTQMILALLNLILTRHTTRWRTSTALSTLTIWTHTGDPKKNVCRSNFEKSSTRKTSVDNCTRSVTARLKELRQPTLRRQRTRPSTCCCPNARWSVTTVAAKSGVASTKKTKTSRRRWATSTKTPVRKLLRRSGATSNSGSELN